MATPTMELQEPVAKKLKRRPVSVRLKLTGEENAALRNQAHELGLRFDTWITRLIVEEFRRGSRLPPAL